MIPGGNTDLPKGMKSPGKGKHRGKYQFFWGVRGWGGHTALEALGDAQPLKTVF